MQEFEFVYHSDFMINYRPETSPLVSVLVQYDTFTGPTYDSPLGGLGVSTHVTNEEVLDVTNATGVNLLSLRDNFIEFATEINHEIERRHDAMVDRLRNYP